MSGNSFTEWVWKSSLLHMMFCIAPCVTNRKALKFGVTPLRTNRFVVVIATVQTKYPIPSLAMTARMLLRELFDWKSFKALACVNDFTSRMPRVKLSEKRRMERSIHTSLFPISRMHPCEIWKGVERKPLMNKNREYDDPAIAPVQRNIRGINTFAAPPHTTYALVERTTERQSMMHDVCPRVCGSYAVTYEVSGRTRHK